MFSGIGLNVSLQHWINIVGAFILAIGVAYWAYRRTNPPLPRRLTALLFALRTIAIGLLVFVLLEPIVNLMWRHTEEPVVAVLVDDSASMSISESGVDRLSQAMTFLESDLRDEIGSKGRLALYRFDEKAVPWSGDSLMSDGLATDIAGALETVKRELGDGNLRGVILLTDGVDNLGHNPAHLARTYDLPIFPVGIGSAEPRKDISLTDVLTTEVVYKDSRVPLEVKIQSRGLEELQAPVTLSSGTEVLDSRPVTLSGAGREQSIHLEYIPRREGMLRLRVSIPPQDGELTAENNQRELSVKVLKSKIKVLLVWGCPGWDFSFLRNSLQRDPNVELTSLVFRGNRNWFLGAFPPDEASLMEFDMFILGDSAPSKLATEQQQWISHMVMEQAKGLLLVGGSGFGLDLRTPLAELAPLSLAAKKSVPVEGPFWAQLTAAGRVHPVMILQEDALDPQQIWENLPPFLGLNPLGPPKPSASILAVHPQYQSGDDPLPLIAVGPAGTGKCMVVAVYPLWRWHFMMVGLGKTGQEYDRFWSNTIRWLTTRDEGRTIRVVPVQNVFRSGQRIGFEARLFDQSYRPMDRAQVKVLAMRKADGDRAEVEGDLFESGRRDGRYRGELPVLLPGEYSYRAEVYLSGQKVGQDEGEFVVEEYSLEFERVELNVELLQDMAQASGGRYFPLTEARDLFAALPLESREITGQRELELWNHPAVLAVLVLLLAAELTIRKKNRLM